MADFEGLIFCLDCSNLLPPSKGDENNILKCDCCGKENKGTCRGRWNMKCTLRSQQARPAGNNSLTYWLILDLCLGEEMEETKPSDFPSPLRQKLSVVQTVERHKVQTERIDANTDCPKCGTRGIRYSEVQQRSADEGSTILYNCDCGHKCVPSHVFLFW